MWKNSAYALARKVSATGYDTSCSQMRALVATTGEQGWRAHETVAIVDGIKCQRPGLTN